MEGPGDLTFFKYILDSFGLFWILLKYFEIIWNLWILLESFRIFQNLRSLLES